MLKRIAKTLGFKKKRTPAGPHIVPPGSHPIVPEDISRAASDVVSGLEKAGYTAYVVGGCVLDLMLGLKPKDFDVATNATPEEVKRLFRRAQIIGRRFRIVHVRFGREVIEVTTFRAHHTSLKKACYYETMSLVRLMKTPAGVTSVSMLCTTTLPTILFTTMLTA